jgi:hypothetical protein
MGLRIGGIITALCLLLALGCSGSSAERTDQAGAIEKPAPVARATSGMSPAVSHCDVMVDDMLVAGNCDIYNDGNLMHFVFTANEMWAFSRVRVYCDTELPDGDIEYRSGHELGTLTSAPYTPGPALSDTPLDIGSAGVDDGLAAGPVTPPLPYELQLESPVSSLHLTFGVGGWSVGEPLYIKADVTAQGRTAVVYSSDSPGEEVFEYYPRPQLNLPSQQILTFLGLGDSGKYETTFYNCPDGFDVKRMTDYVGWCVDLWHIVYPNQMYNVRLYNSYDPDLPERLRDEDWDMVNYVVNHKQGNPNAVQAAIWYFVGGGDYPGSGNAQAMVEEALANGEGYTPPAAGTVVVIVDINEQTQTTAVEVPLYDIRQN